MGCPAGIGPEIILRYFAEHNTKTSPSAIVIGDFDVLEKCSRELNIPIQLTRYNPGSAQPPPKDRGIIPVLQTATLPSDQLQWGRPTLATGRAMAEYIKTGVTLTQARMLDALVTCPISKSSLNDAGFNFPGHTEMLAHLTSTHNYAMMMAGKNLRITLATIHQSFRSVANTLSLPSITRLIELTHQSLTFDFAIDQPRIAVAGLNPHGGENGLFGNEELQIIEPAIHLCAVKGIDVTGPYPPDTVFYKAAQGHFDAVVCMYHDQGLIPFKLLHFADGVNVTIGLPIVRTSVDHGTAYDIAGKGLASCTSLAVAIDLAYSISCHRKAAERRY